MDLLAAALTNLDSLCVALDDETRALLAVDSIGVLDVAGALAVSERRASFAAHAQHLEQHAHDAVAALIGGAPTHDALRRASPDVRGALEPRFAKLAHCMTDLRSAEAHANSVLSARARVLSAYARALRPAPAAYDRAGRNSRSGHDVVTIRQTA